MVANDLFIPTARSYQLPTRNYQEAMSSSFTTCSSSYTSFASIAPQLTSSSNPEQRVPRRQVYTGFAMEKDVMCRWAHLLTGQVYDLDDEDDEGAAWSHLMGYVGRQGGYFSSIGEGDEDIQWMVVTRVDRFDGYRGMPESELPVYKEEQTEKMWRERLTRDGLHPHEYVFKTVLA
ncbi:hypothetical protein Hypma_000551 [Hypsizygus marmoreus]|uniref:Uncharacterized protein n=1 Tax=Hypsizygus marmoreus TaxID=39966 RepID=A0A369J887_HYPMA|nr:hypothetical protein Hypma_000551 [Hypsizygus marmoreus]